MINIVRSFILINWERATGRSHSDVQKIAAKPRRPQSNFKFLWVETDSRKNLFNLDDWRNRAPRCQINERAWPWPIFNMWLMMHTPEWVILNLRLIVEISTYGPIGLGVLGHWTRTHVCVVRGRALFQQRRNALVPGALASSVTKQNSAQRMHLHPLFHGSDYRMARYVADPTHLYSEMSFFKALTWFSRAFPKVLRHAYIHQVLIFLMSILHS